MATKARPVIVLTGFLGSGKTTLLNAYMHAQENIRFAIVENEVGEIGIDGELIIQNKDSMLELRNGCICCSLSQNFTDTLKKLKDNSEWDVLIIEATGIANPGGIMMPFKQFPYIQNHFELSKTICLVDSLHFEEQLTLGKEAASQLAYADIILLNKSDLVSAEKLETLQKKIRSFNPLSEIIIGNKNEFPISLLINFKKDDKTEIIEQTHHEEKHLHGHEHATLNSISFRYTEPFNENALFRRMYTFLMLQSESVYRFKGIFYDPEKNTKMIIQSVMTTLVIEAGEEWKEDETKESRFVFIGKNLIPKGFDHMLKQCFRKS